MDTVSEYATFQTPGQWANTLKSTEINRRDLDLMVLEYLIDEGYENSSVKFARQLGLTPDLANIRVRFQIKRLILAGNVSEAIVVIDKEYPQLLKANVSLHFKLLLLNLIEMIKLRKNDSEELVLQLVQYAQNNLTDKALKSYKFMQELELVMTLLLVPDTAEPLPERLSGLYDENLRRKIAGLVNNAILDLNRAALRVVGTRRAGHVSRDAGRLAAERDEDVIIPDDEERESDDEDAWNANSGWVTKDEGDLFDESNSESDPALKRLLKLWAWTENELHNGDIGVPRVEL